MSRPCPMGWITFMTKTKVTRILRIVFLFWLVVSIALVLTIVTLPPLPDQRHGVKKPEAVFATSEWRSANPISSSR